MEETKNIEKIAEENSNLAKIEKETAYKDFEKIALNNLLR